MFSLSCIEKGANRVITVEAQPVIFNLGLLNNVSGYPAIEPLNYAVYDKDGEMVHILNAHVGSMVGGNEGELVETITLATLLNECNINDNNTVLKLDCEGSEFNILLTSSVEVLRRFAVITMEVHGNTNPNPEYRDLALIEKRMIECGFIKVKYGQMYYESSVQPRILVNVFTEKWVRI
jgi:FkbM family methyltransferase